MTRVLFDLNVLLDVAFDRMPHAEASAALWYLAERKLIEGRVPAHGVTTVFYVVGRERGREAAQAAVSAVLNVFDVAPATKEVLVKATRRGNPDFEDAVCLECAIEDGCDILVTRDSSGFPNSPIPVLDPYEALSLLWSEVEGR